MFRTVVVLLMVLAMLQLPAAGFDTFWHVEAARRVGGEFGFSEDSIKIMELGNFSPDFFGPVSDFASERLQGQTLASLQQFGADNAQARQAAVFLHFDNLNGELESNSKFDYLFSQLLKNTRNALAANNKRTDVDERTRKVLILVTLGASLHAVQDFYSHSDWIHHDFKTAVAGSREWVRKMEENAEARAAIEFEKGWNLKLKEPKLAKELEAGQAVQLALSCAAGKWDGEDPPGTRGVLCKTVLGQSIGAASSRPSRIESIIMGAVIRIAFPLSMKYTGKFWDVYRRYHILEALTRGIASPTRNYNFK